jgi:cell division protein FtsB
MYISLHKKKDAEMKRHFGMIKQRKRMIITASKMRLISLIKTTLCNLFDS